MAKNDVSEKIKKVYKSFMRVKVIGWIVTFTAAVLVARLFYLQIIMGSYYKKLADSNCVNLVKVRAPRGYIFDRNYKKIVNNLPSYAVSIIPYHFAKNDDPIAAVAKIAEILNIDPSEIQKKVRIKQQYLLAPVLIKRDISLEQVSLLTEEGIEINGISVTSEPKRQYPMDNLGCHIMGYVGEVNAQQLKKKKYKDYRGGDIIGQAGVENYYDKTLRGTDGVVYILTDAKGRQKEVLNEVEPKQGKNLVLTIDYRLQKYAEKVMDDYGHKGVVIAEDPKTGEILCMVSKPDYNLNYFSGKLNIKEWKKLRRNKDKPLNNRTIQGTYSPGSIFKIADGVGALAEGIVGTGDGYICDGVYWIKTWPYKCWKRAGHGWVNFYKAIEQSCDIYFYKVGLKMKVELLYKYAKMFGLGERTNIDLPGEKHGTVPSREWKRRVARSPWFPGNTVMMSIGQGYIVSTPIQIMNLASAIANDGYVMEPHVVKAVTMSGRRIFKTIEPKKLFELDVDKKYINTMKKAMGRVVTKRGTGRNALIPGIKVAGKTATVENQQGDTHAMFAGFAPYDNPEIVCYVLVEHGGGGGETAAPVAQKVMEYYLKVMK